MTENSDITFDEQELDALRNLRARFAELTQRLGQLTFEHQLLEQERDQVISLLESLEREKDALMTKLDEKYGKGTVDIDSGKFTPERR